MSIMSDTRETGARARRRVIIADDEPLARERLRTLLAAQAGYTVVAECENGPQTVDAILAHKPDIVLLDIQMPGMSGLEVAQALDEDDGRAPAVVFATAFDEFALRAFDVNAVDYVLKPVDPERLSRALERSESRLRGENRGLDDAVRAVLEQLRVSPSAAYARRFLVRSPKGYHFVQTGDVEWADAQGNYVRLHAGGKAHMIRMTMKVFEEQLDPERFVRVHRSAVVNIDCVERIEPYEHGEYRILLRDGTALTSSRAHSEQLKKLLR
jgi:two-component system LytT family response regulator